EAIRGLVQELRLLPVTGPVAAVKIGVAFVCGVMIAWLYRRTYRGPGYSVAYTNTLILLAMSTAVIIMVIGNNLARAFGLVGALSVVRFRHAVKNTQDIVYVFLALGIGMAAGVGFYDVALVGTVCIGLVILLLYKTRFGTPRRDDYLLQFNYRPTGEKVPGYQAVLDEYCSKVTPINVRTLGETDMIELSFYARLKQRDRSADLISALNRTPGVQFVNLFFDEEQI
ncbi:MAG: DUF4956 domain-containing protein, partial [candidate division WOR-3 bacterium]